MVSSKWHRRAHFAARGAPESIRVNLPSGNLVQFHRIAGGGLINDGEGMNVQQRSVEPDCSQEDLLPLMGNEAIARGAWEAGVKVASAYPGTPSTEILENLGSYPAADINAEMGGE